MQICPLCHRSHNDEPSPGRARVCILCYSVVPDAYVGGPAPVKPKKRSKQTPKPIEYRPPKTE